MEPVKFPAMVNNDGNEQYVHCQHDGAAGGSDIDTNTASVDRDGAGAGVGRLSKPPLDFFGAVKLFLKQVILMVKV